MTHSTSSTHTGTDHDTAHAPDRETTAQPDVQSVAAEAPLNIRLGRQLRSAREARQLDVAACARGLRLPARVLRQLEAGDYTGISEGVYLRNYLATYAACVGLPDDTVQDAIAQLAPQAKRPELISTGGIPRAHYLLERYTTAATYVVLTAVIVVPLVWLGLKGGLDRELTHLEPLNASPVAQKQLDSRAPATQEPTPAGHPAHAENPRKRPAERPLMASMAPFSALNSVDDEVVPRAKPATLPAATVPARHTLSVDLAKRSWVAVTTANGKRLEYSLLPAGTHTVYHSTKPLQVDIGDTTGARVTLDGEPIDLDVYQRGNVAHFRIALDNDQAVVKSM